MGLFRIEDIRRVENIGSGKVMEKAGMSFEGILRKHLLCKGQFDRC
ncbi:GNAT family N-acetyltransferase [Clostridium algidicarnis]